MRAPAFLPLLVGIIAVYGVIVGTGDSPLGEAVRLFTLGAVLVSARRVRRRHGLPVLALLAVVGFGALALVAGLLGSADVAEAVLAAAQFVLVGAAILAILRLLARSPRVDAATVLGVLCVYLLLALLFSALYQLGGALQDGFLVGVPGTPTASDCLYLSVITLATVGYGDITPATQLGRAFAITEALVGQLYLVSVVAAVVAGWRAGRAPPAGS